MGFNKLLSILSRFNFNQTCNKSDLINFVFFQSYQGSILTQSAGLNGEVNITLSILSRFNFNVFDIITHYVPAMLSILSRFNFNHSSQVQLTLAGTFNPIKVQF